MMEFDDFSDKKSETDKLLEKRDKIRDKMAEKLEQLNFSQAQIDEVLKIIDIAEAEISKLKSILIGTNINNDDPTPTMATVLSEIKMKELQMAIDIRAKINEIIEKNKK